MRAIVLAAAWRLSVAAALAATVPAPARAAAPVDLGDYVRRDRFEHIRISPDGRHLAATVHWVNEWMGARDTLAARSPVNLAARIKAPVLLVAGGADTIAPISHSRRMQRALEAHDVPVRTLYVDSEGHGFRSEDNRRRYYAELLSFLAGHLGGATAQ